MRVRMLVAYDGTDFHGWAKQPDDLPTVQGAIEGSMAKVLGFRVPLSVAGRTDAGVHARAQVVSCDLPGDADLFRLEKSLNRLCGPTISVREMQEAVPDFDARFSAVSRVYRYRLRTERFPDPFAFRFSWHVARSLDVEKMNLAGQCLVGEHDFATFCKKGCAGGTCRRVFSLCVLHDETCSEVETVSVWISANAFCHQMVRAIVGLLAGVGEGRRDLHAVEEALHAKDRRANSVVAPPQGLTLWSVQYGEEH